MKSNRTLIAIVILALIMSFSANTIAAARAQALDAPGVSGSRPPQLSDGVSGSGGVVPQPLPPESGKATVTPGNEGGKATATPDEGGVLPELTPAKGGNPTVTPGNEGSKATSTPAPRAPKAPSPPDEGPGEPIDPAPVPPAPQAPTACSKNLDITVDGFYSIGTITICSNGTGHITRITD